MTRVLVTGGAGFIGSHIVDQLVDLGWRVRVLDALIPSAHSARPDYLNPHAEYVWGDLRDVGVTQPAVVGCDAICHQAALVGLGDGVTRFVDHNDLGTASLLEAMEATGFRGRLVLASSMVVYGEGAYRCQDHGLVRPPPRAKLDLQAGRFEPACPRCGAGVIPEAIGEDTPPDPRSVYAATKLHQEHLCAVFARARSVPLTVLRYHNVYGPRMPRDTAYAGVASIFRSALERGEAPPVFEDGGQIRDFIHVADVARANVMALTADEPVATTVNVASGRPATLLEMANAVAGGVRAPVVTGAYRLGDVRHVFGATHKATSELGFTAVVNLREGMAEFRTAPLRAPVSPNASEGVRVS